MCSSRQYFMTHFSVMFEKNFVNLSLSEYRKDKIKGQ